MASLLSTYRRNSVAVIGNSSFREETHTDPVTNTRYMQGRNQGERGAGRGATRGEGGQGAPLPSITSRGRKKRIKGEVMAKKG